ncbi:hypothetical protein Mpsy_2660 [Methanolobus psychrophilus R15]|nr:hypothetical protein Mpsy_2660 [Methanolobus psychrophilus R15]
MPACSPPTLIISKCLGFSPCRYNGKMISFPVADDLKHYVKFITVCPECEIELGVPRKPIRIVLERGEYGVKETLVQPATEMDLTEAMADFTAAYLDKLAIVDGAILKSRSPSCGTGSTKVFASASSIDCLHRKGTGLFAEGLTGHFPYLPVVDEEQIADSAMRDHFLTRVFAMASFREVSESGKMHKLVEFHMRNKLLLMAYDKEAMTMMGDIVANHVKRPFGEVVQEYGRHLRKVLSRPAGTGPNINVLMHAAGYFSDSLDPDEKSLLEDRFREYRQNDAVLGELKKMFMSWILHYNVEYLLKQTYFCPYPEELSGSLRQV